MDKSWFRGLVLSFRPAHELHRRRLGRNIGLGLVLIALVSIVFGLTIVKVSNGGNIEAFDHITRPALVPVGKE
mgnify:FL=1